MRKILITGATGFIGSNLIEKFRHPDYHVYGISKNGGMINNTLINAVDCTDQEAVNSYCKGKSFDAIIHLAASVPFSFYDEAARQSLLQNVKMTLNLLENFREYHKSVFIYASSTSIYGYPKKLPVTETIPAQPDGFYPLGKFFSELICQQYQQAHNLCIAILRISAPYGMGMRRETVVTKFIKRALLSEDLTLYGTGRRSQDFTYIEDIVNAIVLAHRAKATGIFNISSGVSVSMKKLAHTILRVLPDSKSKILYTATDDPQEDYRAAFSFERAKDCFGYQPHFALDEGIKEYVEGIKKELRL